MALAVFLGIIVVEAAILIPSARNYERDLFVRLEHAGLASVKAGFLAQAHYSERNLLFLGELFSRNSDVRGGALYRDDGNLIGTFGETPELTVPVAGNGSGLLSADGNRYEVFWPAEATGLPFAVIARLDASWIRGEVRAFVWRIIGLVLLISTVVSAVTLLTVGWLVLVPMLGLRRTLLAAADDPEHPERYRFDASRADELGDVNKTINDLLGRIAGNIVKLREREDALNDANECLEQRVAERTAELVESETLLRAVVDNAPAEVALKDTDGRYELINREVARRYHVTEEEAKGKTVHEIYPKAAADQTVVEDRKVLDTGKTVVTEEQVVYDDAVHTNLVVRFPVKNPAGKITKIGVFATDITERKRAEAALRESETRVLLVMENLPAPVAYVDNRQRYQFVNNAYESWLGRPRDDIVGRQVRDVLGDENYDRMQGQIERTLAGDPVSFEMMISLRGEERHVHASYVPHAGKQGEIEGMFALITDITDRKRAEEVLRESEARVRMVLDNVADCIVTSDEKGRILSFNPAAERVFGYAADEVIGENVSLLMDAPDRGRHGAYIRSYLRTGKGKILGVGPRDVTGRRKDGLTVPLDLAVSEMFLGGARVFIATLRDATDRRVAEVHLQQALKLEAVGQLTGGIAHDFNNLLTVILGNLQLLERRVGGDERLSKRIRAASGAALRGAELTKRLLAFSRRQVLEPEVTDLNNLVAGMDDLLRRTLGETIEINVSLEADLWPVRVDVSQLENALLNLAVNARDAMPQGGKLTIETANARLDEAFAARHTFMTAGPYVMLAVNDTGSGMPPEVIEHAFEPFFTTKEVGKGTGLGLSMVYGFVKQSGGHVIIYSEEGHGTTVKLYLPRAEPGDAAAVEEAAPGPAVEAGGETILVVEDDAAVREIAVSLLRDHGYHVLEAEDGAAALKILDDHPDIDLLLTDVVMPGGMGGPDLARNARERRPDLKVLFTSGYAEHAIAHGGVLGEGVEILGKPYQTDEMMLKVRRVLDS